MITVTITPTTTEHVAILAQAMRNLIACDPAKPQPKLAAIEEPTPTPVEPEAPAAVEAPVAKPKAPKKAAPAPGISLEEVRALLSVLHTSGKTDEVKALLAEYGAVKLPDLAPENYAAVLTKAGAL